MYDYMAYFYPISQKTYKNKIKYLKTIKLQHLVDVVKVNLRI